VSSRILPGCLMGIPTINPCIQKSINPATLWPQFPLPFPSAKSFESLIETRVFCLKAVPFPHFKTYTRRFGNGGRSATCQVPQRIYKIIGIPMSKTKTRSKMRYHPGSCRMAAVAMHITDSTVSTTPMTVRTFHIWLA
jgi:hypothetical protein